MIFKKRQLLVFILAGFVALILEILIITFLTTTINLSSSFSRLFSLPPAVFLTWILNRRYGFLIKTPPNFFEFFKYLKANIVAQSINLFGYICLTSSSSFFSSNILVSLCAATLVSVVLSFLLYYFYVFDDKS